MAKMIEVDGLGKKYRLGGQDKYYSTLRESMVRAIMRPFRRFSGKGVDDDAFWALRNVNFSVDAGEVVGIIGRNGAGKSTLLKLLSRITRPTEGCARLYGRVGSLLEVGTGFHPELTGRENIALSGTLLGMTRAEVKRKFDEIVDFAEIERFLDTPVKHYSSGMYVRLGFAIAAHLEPEILLVDEVLAVGDAQFQKKCLGKMNDVAKDGRTVLFVSHNMDAIKTLCSRAIWIDHAGIRCDSDALETCAEYLGVLFVSDRGLCLSDTPRSRGMSLDAKITDLKISDSAGCAVSLVAPDKPAIIEVSVTVKKHAAFTLWVALRDEMQRVLLTFRSHHDSGECYQLDPGSYCIRLRLDPTWLTGGSYYGDIALCQPGDAWVCLDHLPSSFSFHVADLDPYGAGAMHKSECGVYRVDHVFSEAKYIDNAGDGVS